MRRVQVLLSTYNGERFLKEQLDSLRAQVGVDLMVLARDDGSTDKTVDILKKYSLEWTQLKIIEQGPNLGVINSFFELLRHADSTAEFFAFCDQDDLWMPQKLLSAVSKLSNVEELPALYFGRLQYVNESLQKLGLSRIPRQINFGNALIENLATGCTVVFNRQLLQKARMSLPTKNVLMHDWWMFLCALGLGQVVYDAEPMVLYRQHSANVVGGTSSFFATYWIKAKRFIARRPCDTTLSHQAMAFFQCFQIQINSQNRTWLGDFLKSRRGGWLSRCRYALRLPLRRQLWLDNFLFRMLILLGRY